MASTVVVPESPAAGGASNIQLASVTSTKQPLVSKVASRIDMRCRCRADVPTPLPFFFFRQKPLVAAITHPWTKRFYPEDEIKRLTIAQLPKLSTLMKIGGSRQTL